MDDSFASSAASFGGGFAGQGGGFGGQMGPTTASNLPPNVAPVPLLAVWSIPASSRSQSDQIFLTLDSDQDGLVNGLECKNLFLQSGLSPPILAQIWALCDIRKNGLLNSEQFALSFFLIQQKVRHNLDPPASLPPDMVPPSMRMYQTQFPVPGVTMPENLDDDEGGDEELRKELKSLEDEIEKIRQEKRILVEETEARKAEIHRRQSELQNMSKEVETLHGAAKQLDTQRVEAQKRLDDLDSQKKRVQSSVAQLAQELESEKQKLASAKEEMERRQSGQRNQEEELKKKRQELHRLKQEEMTTLQKIDSQRAQLAGLERSLVDGDGRIAQIEETIIKAEKFNATLKEAISQFDAALDTQDISSVNADYLYKPLSELTVHAGHVNFDPISAVSAVHYTPPVQISEDPFQGEDPFAKASVSDDPWGASPFGGSDPFGGGGGGGGFPPESPLPALPPKKPMGGIPQQNTGGRQPPPRPAPPKNGAKKKEGANPSRDAFEADPWGASSAASASNSHAFPAFDEPAPATFATDFDDFGKF